MLHKPALAVLLAVSLSACTGIPTVEDPGHPEVDGESMSSVQFLQTYCMGENDNITCNDVRNALAQDLKSLSPPGGGAANPQ